jgi:hypothetical protein
MTSKKSKIDAIWEIASKQPDIAQRLAEKLVKKSDLIVAVGDCYANNDPYSYYRIYNSQGEYRFAIPGWLDFEESQFHLVDTIITKPSQDPSKSRNGGEYHEGYRIEKIPNKNIFRVTFSWALRSDFEDQCSDKPEILYSLQEVAEFTGCDIDLSTL